MPLLSHSSLTTTRYFFFSLPFPVFLVSRSPSFFFFFLFSSLSNRIHLVGVFRDQFVGTREDARCAGSAITESVSVALGDFRGLKWRGGKPVKFASKILRARQTRFVVLSLSLSFSFHFLERESKRERERMEKGESIYELFFFFNVSEKLLALRYHFMNVKAIESSFFLFFFFFLFFLNVVL